MKRWRLACLAVAGLLVALGLGLAAATGLARYAGFDTARSGRPVQVLGTVLSVSTASLAPGVLAPGAADGDGLRLVLSDGAGGVLVVEGVVRQAASISVGDVVVVAGRFEGGRFVASRLLRKCSSHVGP
jgi:cytochrome c-type biogenesis protein CcmE